MISVQAIMKMFVLDYTPDICEQAVQGYKTVIVVDNPVNKCILTYCILLIVSAGW